MPVWFPILTIFTPASSPHFRTFNSPLLLVKCWCLQVESPIIAEISIFAAESHMFASQIFSLLVKSQNLLCTSATGIMFRLWNRNPPAESFSLSPGVPHLFRCLALTPKSLLMPARIGPDLVGTPGSPSGTLAAYGVPTKDHPTQNNWMVTLVSKSPKSGLSHLFMGYYYAYLALTKWIDPHPSIRLRVGVLFHSCHRTHVKTCSGKPALHPNHEFVSFACCHSIASASLHNLVLSCFVQWWVITPEFQRLETA